MNNFSTIVLCLNVLLLTSACNNRYDFQEQNKHYNRYSYKEHSIQCYSDILHKRYKDAETTCWRACEENVTESCERLGWLYSNANYKNKDEMLSKKYYEKACNLGSKSACSMNINNDSSASNISIDDESSQRKGEYYFSLGWSYANGENGYTKDYSKAKSFYEKACNLDNGGGCNNLGVLYAHGNGVAKNIYVALYYYEKACKLNNENGCSNSGYMYIDGLGTAQDYQKAKLYYNKSCTLGNKNSCNVKFNNNRSDSKISYEEQCSQGKGKYCSLLGRYYEKGENGYTKNYSEAIEFYRKACNLNNGDGCNDLGFLYARGKGVDKNDIIALYLIEKSCNLNFAIGCFNLGSIYYDGKGVSQDYQKGKSFFNKACNLGYKDACNFNLNKKNSSPKVSYEESCRRGNSSDCFTVGTFYEKGSNGYARNYLQAKTYYDKACTLRNSEGCHALGMLFVEGQGVNEDFNTAKFYFKKACDLGKDESCVFYNELK